MEYKSYLENSNIVDNGNVSAMRWRNIANPEESSKYRNYAFRYDGVNRLLQADYGEGLSVIDKQGYDVSGISYVRLR